MKLLATIGKAICIAALAGVLVATPASASEEAVGCTRTYVAQATNPPRPQGDIVVVGADGTVTIYLANAIAAADSHANHQAGAAWTYVWCVV